MKKRIGVIGHFPPPMHGLAKALDTLINSSLKSKYELTKFNIVNNMFFIVRIIQILLSNLDVYYFTISQSKFGNIRDLIIIRIIQLKKKRIIIHLHGGAFRDLLDQLNGFQKKINYRLLGKVDSAIVLGDSLKFIFSGIIDDRKIKVVKNCVDSQFVIDDYTFKEKIHKFEDNNDVTILYLSNFLEDKGYKSVLELAKRAKDDKNNRLKFVFAGKFFVENDKNEFFRYINKNNLGSTVSYKGIVLGEEKKELLKECDYFILLSKNEGQPISIIEAAVNGLRVISTNCPGILDILNQDEMILCDKDNPDIEMLYSDILQEINNKKSLIDILDHNRKKMLANFSEEKYIKDLDEIFENI